MLTEYCTVAREAEATLIEKKSKFLGRVTFVQTVDQAEAFIEGVRKAHWDATHNVPAYIIGINQEIQKYSDDNEPSGTAGLPVLEVLKARGLVNIVAVVTRYFGGTLLGRGGLVRAYSRAAREALRAAGIVRMIPVRQVAITVDYMHAGKIQNELLSREVLLRDTQYLEQVTFQVLLPTSKIDPLRLAIQDFTANEFGWQEGKQVYHPIAERVGGER